MKKLSFTFGILFFVLFSIFTLIIAQNEKENNSTPQTQTQTQKDNNKEAETKAKVAELAKKLKSGNDEEKNQAFKALAEIGKPAVPAIIEALKDKNVSLREQAVLVLGKIVVKSIKSKWKPVFGLSTQRPISAVSGLIVALKDKEKSVRQKAVSELARIGMKTVKIRLQEQNYSRFSGCGIFREVSPIPGLVEALKDKEISIREQAVSALGKIAKISVDPKLFKKGKAESDDEPPDVKPLPGIEFEPEYPKGPDEGAVYGLITALENGNESVSNIAKQALANISNYVIDTLIKSYQRLHKSFKRCKTDLYAARLNKKDLPELIIALKDKDDYVRLKAIRTISAIEAKSALPAVIEALKDESVDFRLSAIWYFYLFRDDKSVLPAFSVFLNDKNWYLREKALEVLTYFSDKKAIVPLLIKALKDKKAKIRKKAIGYLYSFDKEKKSLPEILKLLEDENESVVGEVAEVLVSWKVKNALPELIKLCKSSKRPNVRILEVFGEIGDKSTLPLLLKALKNEDFWVRKVCVEALGEIGDKSSIPAIKKALKDDNFFVRAAAVWALYRIDGKSVLPDLIQALNDKSTMVREYAARVLGYIGDKSAVPALIKALEDSDSGVRSRAAYGLRKFRNKSAVPALIKALNDKVHWARSDAAWALYEIAGKDAIKPLQESFNKVKDVESNIDIAGYLIKLNSPDKQEKIEFLVEVLEEKLSKAIENEILEQNEENLIVCNLREIMKIFYESGNKSIIKPLQELFDKVKNKLTKVIIAQALIKLNAPDKQEKKIFIVIATKFNEGWAKYKAYQTLLEFADNSMIYALTELLVNGHVYYRKEAAAKLGEIGNKSAIPYLRKVVKESAYEEVRKAALEAITKIESVNDNSQTQPDKNGNSEK